MSERVQAAMRVLKNAPDILRATLIDCQFTDDRENWEHAVTNRVIELVKVCAEADRVLLQLHQAVIRNLSKEKRKVLR